MATLKELLKVASSLSILYVEDNKNIAKTVVSYLSKIFGKVIYADNGKKALELYLENTVDIILTDINMPQMNGITLSHEIRKINEKQNIVFVTAYSEKEILLEAIEIGVDGYLVKPIDFEKVNNLLYKICLNIKNSYENEINIEQQSFLLNHISQKNKLLRQYTEIIDKVAIVSKSDLFGNITYANDLFCEVSGYKKDELIGANHNILRHPDMPSSVYKNMWETIEKGDVWEGTIKNKAKDGSAYFVHSTIIPVFTEKVFDYYIAIRFLSTNEETKKEEFKYKAEILNNKLLENNKINEIKISDLEKRLKKAIFEVSHYEKAFTTKSEKKYDTQKNYRKNLNDMTLKYQNTLKELNIKKNELANIKIDNEEKKEELIKIKDANIEQRKIIKDLRNTLENDTSIEKKIEPEKKKTIFGIFK